MSDPQTRLVYDKKTDGYLSKLRVFSFKDVLPPRQQQDRIRQEMIRFYGMELDPEDYSQDSRRDAAREEIAQIERHFEHWKYDDTIDLIDFSDFICDQHSEELVEKIAENLLAKDIQEVRIPLRPIEGDCDDESNSTLTLPNKFGEFIDKAACIGFSFSNFDMPFILEHYVSNRKYSKKKFHVLKTESFSSQPAGRRRLVPRTSRDNDSFPNHEISAANDDGRITERYLKITVCVPQNLKQHAGKWQDKDGTDILEKMKERKYRKKLITKEYVKELNECTIESYKEEKKWLKDLFDKTKWNCCIVFGCRISPSVNGVDDSPSESLDEDDEHASELEPNDDSADGLYDASTKNQTAKGIQPFYYWNLEGVKYQGENKVIAVLDTGIDENHPAFFEDGDPKVSKIIAAVNFCNDEGYVKDCDGHGTMCAGVACGSRFTVDRKFKGDKHADVVHCPPGIASKAKLIICKVGFNIQNFNHDAIVRALKWLKARKVDVVSMSIGRSSYSFEQEKAITELVADGVVIVCSASNYGQRFQQPICYPAQLGHVLCIGSHNAHGKPSDYCPVGQQMDFLAPGDEIVCPFPIPKKIETGNGTSFSAPAVAGLVCLILECIDLTNKDFKDALQRKFKISKCVDDNKKPIICNQWMIKEILRNMATNPGIHFNDRGYGSLHPRKFLDNPEFFIKSSLEMKID